MMPATSSKKQKVKSAFFILSALFYICGLFVIVFLGVIYKDIFLKDYVTIATWVGALLSCALGIEKSLTNRKKQVVGIYEVVFGIFVIMMIIVFFWFGVLRK